MSRPGLFPSMTLLRRRQPTLSEVEMLLELFPQAAFLLDLQLNRVLLANANAIALTAFTRAELGSLELDALLPGVARFPRQSGRFNNTSGSPATLNLRNGSALEILVNLVRLDSLGTWALATVEPFTAYQRRQATIQRQSQRLEDLLNLVEATQEDEAGPAIQAALEAGLRMAGASVIAAYLLEADDTSMRQAAGCGELELLPARIPAEEVRQVIEASTWIAGKRASTSLQRAARAANLSYLVTLPLGKPGAVSGALVVACPYGPLPDDEAPLLDILATSLTSLVEDQAFRANLAAEQARLERALAIGQAVQEVSHEGVIVANRELAIVEMNPAAELVLGYATLEVAGQPLGNILIGAENLAPALQSALQGIATPNMGNVRLHRRDGSAFLAHVQILPVPGAERLDAIVVLLRDLSEHEQFQLRSEHLEQRALLGEVTAIFAHEVRNPINNLSTGLQLMALNLPSGDPNQEVIARLSQDCNRLTHLMDSVLSFSRAPENTMEAVDLGELLPALLERWRPRLVRLNVQHRCNATPGKAVISGDPRALEQVFNNLIGNAVQAMSASGGALTINLRCLDDPGDRPQVEISVSDNGPGVPEEIRERIFEPFFTTNRNGTGLGLAIAKQIITKHKGTIRVSSVPGGTAFQVILPLTGV